LYVTTPVLVPLAWWRNRATDPGRPEPGEPPLPVFVRPAALMMGLDGRWSAIRITLESQLIGLALILVGTARAWQDVDATAPGYGFVASIATRFAALLALEIATVSRSRPYARSGAAPARRSPLTP
jgi:hypothetical protein